MPEGALAPKARAETGQRPRLLIVLKGYPRVSETFIAQELLGLQRAGLDFEIVSLRHPYDAFQHPVHDEIRAPVLYLPERLRQEPGRVLAALRAVGVAGFGRALSLFLKDVRRDPTSLRLRCFGQAMVLANEVPPGALWLHAHFAHTPTSVARYAAAIRGAAFSISAHAKDIWTTPDWDLGEKLNEAGWTVTCTEAGRARLAEIAPAADLHLVYHGLDLVRFPEPPVRHSSGDGSDPDAPVRILSVGRAVPKKGYDTILAALAALPASLHWRFDHIGGGTELERLQAEAERLSLGPRVTWHGPKDQADVLAAYRSADLFVLASRPGTDQDRDGLPNVLVEAASQRLACVATRFSAIPELIEDGHSGLLVPPDDAPALTRALAQALKDPDLRASLGKSAGDRVRRDFDVHPGIRRLLALFEAGWSGGAC